MRWLITGGCGFIGRNLIKNLLHKKGNFIRVIDNLTVGTRDDLSMVAEFEEINAAGSSPLRPLLSSEAPLQLIVGDVLDEKLALIVCQDIDFIVHLAANTGVGPSVENPRMDCQVNVLGTLNYLEAARDCNVKRFIFASSGAPAGECEPPIHEELPPHPVSPYGASKLSGEGYCSAYFRTFNVETVCLRFGNVYGPLSGKKDSVVAKFIKSAMDKLALEIYGDGKQTRDFIYIDDLIQAVLLASRCKNIGGEIFQIATNKETTIGEMTEILVSILHKYGISKIDVLHAKARMGDVKRNYSDTTKAREILGWVPQVSIEQGLGNTVAYFADRQQSRSDGKVEGENASNYT